MTKLLLDFGHEIAHHYVFLYYPKAKQGHGPEFRKIMNILQLNSETYHSMQLQNGPTKIPELKQDISIKRLLLDMKLI